MAVLGVYLLAKCPDCGKKYKIPVNKLKKKRMSFACTSCTAQVRIIRPDAFDPPISKPSEEILTTPGMGDISVEPSKKSFRVPIKSYLPLLLTYLVICAALIYMADSHMRDVQSKNLRSSSDIAKFITQKMVVQLSEVMAEQASHYLAGNPYLPLEDFNTDPYFRKSVLQKIGVSGTTWLYQIGRDKKNWKILVDYQPSRVGRSMQEMDKVLGEYFPQYWDIVSSVGPERGARGVSKWPDSDGTLRDIFIAATPVEGTPYVLGASIFMDEITVPFKRLATDEVESVRQTILLLLLVAGFGLILLLIIAFISRRPVAVED